jgi:hypothetical protein
MSALPPPLAANDRRELFDHLSGRHLAGQIRRRANDERNFSVAAAPKHDHARLDPRQQRVGKLSHAGRIEPARFTSQHLDTGNFARLIAVCEEVAPLAIFNRNSSASRRAFFNSSCKFETVAGSSLREVLSPLLTSIDQNFASRKRSYASMPVTARMRRTPDAIDSSLVILNSPISPVARTCVPPQSSFEKTSLRAFDRKHAHLLAVLLTKQRHRARAHRFFNRHLVSLHRLVAQDVIVDETLDLFFLGAPSAAGSA